MTPNRSIALCYIAAIVGAALAVLTIDSLFDIAREESLVAPLVVGSLFAAFAVTIVLGFRGQ